MGTPPDDLEEKVNLLLENIATKERKQALERENKELKREVSDLEKQLRPFQKPVGEKPNSTSKTWKKKLFGGVIAASLLGGIGYHFFYANLAQSHYNQAVQLQGEGHYEEAIDELNAVIHLDPKNADAYWARGNSFSMNKEYELAIRDLSTAIRLNPTKGVYWRDRGFAYKNTGECNQAITDFTKNIELLDKENIGRYPPHTDFLTYQGRGECFFMERRYDEAIEDYTRAIVLVESTTPMLISPRDLYHLRGQAWLQKRSDYSYNEYSKDEHKSQELGYREPGGRTGE